MTCPYANIKIAYLFRTLILTNHILIVKIKDITLELGKTYSDYPESETRIKMGQLFLQCLLMPGLSQHINAFYVTVLQLNISAH